MQELVNISNIRSIDDNPFRDEVDYSRDEAADYKDEDAGFRETDIKEK